MHAQQQQVRKIPILLKRLRTNIQGKNMQREKSKKNNNKKSKKRCTCEVWLPLRSSGRCVGSHLYLQGWEKNFKVRICKGKIFKGRKYSRAKYKKDSQKSAAHVRVGYPCAVAAGASDPTCHPPRLCPRICHNTHLTNCTIPDCTIPHHTIPNCTIPHHTKPKCTIPNHTIQRVCWLLPFTNHRTIVP